MYPFDPAWSFAELIQELNRMHPPGSITSGKTRNALIYAWAMFVGRDRASREIDEALATHGSASRLAKWIKIRNGELTAIVAYARRCPPRNPLEGLTLTSLGPAERKTITRLVAALLQDAPTARQLADAASKHGTASLASAALRATELRQAVSELRGLLDGGVVTEREYQGWCERHSWAFGSAYLLNDRARGIEPAKVTDLLLSDVTGYRDVIELKRPDSPVLRFDRSHRNYYLSSECSRAVAQVSSYMERLHALARSGLPHDPAVLGYYPRAVIVIGRSKTWDVARVEAHRCLVDRLHGISLITYDHLLARASSVLSTLEGGSAAAPARGVRRPREPRAL